MTKKEKSKLTVISDKLGGFIDGAEAALLPEELVRLGRIEQELKALTR